MRVLIIGAGGHGQVVADIFLQMQAAGSDIKPVGFLDDDPSLLGVQFLDLPVLGALKDVWKIEHDGLIVAIGSNRTRQAIFIEMQKQGESIATAQHPKAIIASGVEVGPGCMIMAGVVVNTGSTIGQNTILNTSCTVDHHCHLAAHSHIAPGVHLGGEVAIMEGALLGIGATVMPRRQVGAWATVGAGSVVHSNVPDHSTVAGVPAKALRGK